MRSYPALALSLCTSELALAQTGLTVYNQDFAVVKERRNLELARGENVIRINEITAHLEPESVIVRGVRSDADLRIPEQNYESDPLSQGLLPRKFEGREIDFELSLPGGGREVVRGRVLRSGYVPHPAANPRSREDIRKLSPGVAASISPDGSETYARRRDRLRPKTAARPRATRTGS